MRTRQIKSLGREDLLDPAEVDSLIQSFGPYASVAVGESGHTLAEVEPAPGREYGSMQALDLVWRKLELGEALTDLMKGRRFAFPVADVVKATVFGRVLHPGSERALVTTW